MMKKRSGSAVHNFTLIQRLLIVLSLAAVLGLSAVLGFSHQILKNHGRLELRHSIELLTETLDMTLSSGHFSNLGFNEILELLPLNEAVLGAAFADPRSGEILYSPEMLPESFFHNWLLEEPDKISSSDRQMVFIDEHDGLHGVKIIKNGSLLFDVLIDEKHYLKEYRKLSYQLIVSVTIVFVFFAVVVTSMIYLWFKNPLKNLSDATARVSNGDLTAKVEIHVPREFEQLGEIFNRMTSNLKNQNLILEETVNRRTRELKDSLKKLSETQNQMIQQERLASLGQLAAGIAHEINNPASYLYSNSQTLKEYLEVYDRLIELYRRRDTCADSADRDSLNREIEELIKKEDMDFIAEDLKSMISDAQTGITKITEIVKSLRSFARKDELTREPVNLNNVVRNSLKLVWNKLKYKARVEEQLNPVPDISANANQLEQVLVNMLVNAADAIQEDRGLITVRTFCRASGNICVEVEDNGSGITPEEQKRIFEPFYSTKEKNAGTGLGLSISLGIVQSHSGEIELDSEVGRGTIFRLVFPPPKETGEERME